MHQCTWWTELMRPHANLVPGKALGTRLARASGKAGIRNPESGIGTGIGTGTGTGTGMRRETYIKAGTTFTLI